MKNILEIMHSTMKIISRTIAKTSTIILSVSLVKFCI